MLRALHIDRYTSRLLACAVLLASVSGCNVWKLQRKLQVTDKLAFSEYHDLKKTMQRSRKLARSEFELYKRRCRPRQCSESFEAGFLDGYVDHLTYGGDGTPPIAPPRAIWRDRNRNAANEWFHGFSTGSGIAIQSGRRRQNTLPLSFHPTPEIISPIHDATTEQISPVLSDSESLGLPTVSNHDFAASLIEAPSMQVLTNHGAGPLILQPAQEKPNAPVYP